MVGKITPDDKCTCSNLFYILGGESKWSTPNKVLDQCIRAKNGENIRYEQNSVQEVGDALEGVVATLAAKRLGLTNLDTDITIPVKHDSLPLWGSVDATATANNLTITPDEEWAIYTETEEPMVLQGKGVIEIKCTADFPSDDGVPKGWRGLIQAKGQMACMNGEADWAVIATLYRSTLLQIFVMRRDFKFEREIADKVLDFDRRVIEEDYFPAFSLSDTALLYPQANEDKLVDLEPDAKTYVEQILNADETIKSATKIKEKANASLQDMMKDAQFGRVDKFQVNWGTTTRKTKMVSIPLETPETKRNKTVRIKEIKEQ
jgi:predicted phage-related endonuclease